MNTEITDESVGWPAGWIFFDANCRFCVASRQFCGPLFERRGFVWMPLQTPGTAQRLGVTPELLMAEMWVLPAGASPARGIDAWILLMRHVWWLKPIGAVLRLPGLQGLAKTGYRWFARHRYCIAGRCRLPTRPHRKTHRHASFLEFP